jgi:hypothetical protein
VLLLICTSALRGWGNQSWPGQPELTRYLAHSRDADHLADPTHFSMCSAGTVDLALGSPEFCYVPAGSTFTLTSFTVLLLGDKDGGIEQDCSWTVEYRGDVSNAEGTQLPATTIEVGDEGSNSNCVGESAGYVMEKEEEQCLVVFRQTVVGPASWRLHVTDNGGGANTCDNSNFTALYATGYWGGP